MTELISLGVISFLLVGMFIYHIIVVKEFNKQIRELAKLIRARDLTEYAISDNNKDKQKNVMEEEILPDFIPADNVDDETFERMIEKQLENAIR